MRAASLAVVTLLVVAAWATPAQAQFRNAGVQGHVGYLGLGTWDLLLNGGKPAEQSLDVLNGAVDPGWNLIDQPTVGASGFKAIGYQTWAELAVSLGALTTVIDRGDQRTPVLTVSTVLGLRYNFLEERHRPYVGAAIHYLQLVAFSPPNLVAPVPGNNFLGNTPFFIGLKPHVGYEWIFGDEQGVLVELGVTGFLVPDERGLGNLFLPATSARVGYNVYF